MPDLIPAWRLRAAGTGFFLLGNLLPDFFDLRTNDTFPEFLSSFLLCDAEKGIFDTCPACLLLSLRWIDVLSVSIERDWIALLAIPHVNGM